VFDLYQISGDFGQTRERSLYTARRERICKRRQAKSACQLKAIERSGDRD
jgi:hypothetical protein